ncbi:MAG TPA: cell division protein SepF [Actinomycetota bacterium]|nr:cell division protein SepF [Actinomycetota bacterium]
MAGFWKKALVYLGLVEEEDELEPLPEVHEPPQLETVRPIRPDVEPNSVRRIPSVPDTSTRPVHAGATLIPPPMVVVVEPRTFEDAKEIGDKLRVDAPVIMNLQGVDARLGKELLCFASGLTYGLQGGMKKVADRVFLLTPANVEVSAEETQRIISERGFFNQF